MSLCRLYVPVLELALLGKHSCAKRNSRQLSLCRPIDGVCPMKPPRSARRLEAVVISVILYLYCLSVIFMVKC